MRANPDASTPRWHIRLMWLGLYWLAGVAVMGLAALVLRWLMAAVGLSS